MRPVITGEKKNQYTLVMNQLQLSVGWNVLLEFSCYLGFAAALVC